MDPRESLKTRPKSVALLGLGRSYAVYVGHKCQSQLGVQFDEVWTVNFGAQIFRHDKVFVMDDLRSQAKLMPQYGLVLRDHDKPIITSAVYPEFPMAVEYPVLEIIKFIGDDFLNSSVAYAIAWAMYIGVKEISLYGCDFHYPDMNRRELGGQCAAYLLGLARHYGMNFSLPEGTTLMDAHNVTFDEKGRPTRPLYGYAVQPNREEPTDNGRHADTDKDRGMEERPEDAAAKNGGPPTDYSAGEAERAADVDTERESVLGGRPAG